MVRIAEAASSAEGKLAVITDTGSVMMQSPEIGLGYQHLPASQRPPFVWVTLDAPPWPAVRILFNGTGPQDITVLATDGSLYRRVQDRSVLRAVVYMWAKVEMPL
jgi:hypothetical protein